MPFLKSKAFLLLLGIASIAFIILLRNRLPIISDYSKFLDGAVPSMDQIIAAFQNNPVSAGISSLVAGVPIASLCLYANSLLGSLKSKSSLLSNGQAQYEQLQQDYHSLQESFSNATNIFEYKTREAIGLKEIWEKKARELADLAEARRLDIEEKVKVLQAQGEKITTITSRAEKAESIVQNQVKELTKLNDSNGLLNKTLERVRAESQQKLDSLSALHSNEISSLNSEWENKVNSTQILMDAQVESGKKTAAELKRITDLYLALAASKGLEVQAV